MVLGGWWYKWQWNQLGIVMGPLAREYSTVSMWTIPTISATEATRDLGDLRITQRVGPQLSSIPFSEIQGPRPETQQAGPCDVTEAGQIKGWERREILPG